MKDFKNYKPEENGNTKGASNEQVEQSVNLAAAMAKAFEGKSEGQIWQILLQQAEQGKRNGTLTNADLDNFYNAVSPMVDGFKRQKLKQIIAKLKAL